MDHGKPNGKDRILGARMSENTEERKKKEKHRTVNESTKV